MQTPEKGGRLAGGAVNRSASYVNFALLQIRSIVRLRGIDASATSISVVVTLQAEQANQHAVFRPRPALHPPLPPHAEPCTVCSAFR